MIAESRLQKLFNKSVVESNKRDLEPNANKAETKVLLNRVNIPKCAIHANKKTFTQVNKFSYPKRTVAAHGMYTTEVHLHIGRANAAFL